MCLRIQTLPDHLFALSWCALGPVTNSGQTLTWCSQLDPDVLTSLCSSGFSPEDPQSLVTENHPWLHFLELAQSLVGSGGGVQSRVTQPNTQGYALGVHIGELLTDLQCGAL